MDGRLLSAPAHNSSQASIHTHSALNQRCSRSGSPYFPATGMRNGETYASRKPARITRDVATMVRRAYIFHISEGNREDFGRIVAFSSGTFLRKTKRRKCLLIIKLQAPAIIQANASGIPCGKRPARRKYVP